MDIYNKESTTFGLCMSKKGEGRSEKRGPVRDGRVLYYVYMYRDMICTWLTRSVQFKSATIRDQLL